ncbi:putative Fe-S oxidoreductase [Frankia casuarinae]|uniref:Radical SAM n=1 Tax=Frankia casuarinae (strain DSM 45818 / CECT 9043 / HFP020203 / CcI3) TaxID=106370 RepID=Q2J9Y5_FRACC|nr:MULTISPECIES: radical SAM protein [Frankia]ABD11907.1 Radical SAM [Frankia casuarinae]ESZ99810.1 putative Fe-S oxidoreductase [Frankia sp. CcI6]EYT89627.1 putative Fe-S oxidoreductase [Frankia casuarinae]KDA40521.1 putative Fe-S oxidoreductase [Frankia sp. BMG5.23]OAA18196.1 radical SAM additional 4Fe4S-binding SPASM domain-containing protein [Frankia casuarinae]
MTTFLDLPHLRPRDDYGHARMPRRADAPAPEHIDRIAYGRFRNVYLYITEACQLRCEHCYMGERLERALKMPLPQITETLRTWRRMGGSKLTILGGEPTLHPNYIEAIRLGRQLGYEDVITTTNAQKPAARKFRQLEPADFAYVQVSLDGGSAATHDQVRGEGTFDVALETTAELAGRGFDTRIICTVNRANRGDALKLLDLADEIGVSLVKFHVFSTIGTGHGNADMAMGPSAWVTYCDVINQVAPAYKTRVWYQPTYARRNQMSRYAAEGYQGCIGRTLDRISIFPDGRCYVCSYLFDTDLNFARMQDGQVVLNREANEFDLFTQPLMTSACGGCKASACQGGCPAEEVVMGGSSCAAEPDIVPVCRLWKSSAKPED